MVGLARWLWQAALLGAVVVLAVLVLAPDAQASVCGGSTLGFHVIRGTDGDDVLQGTLRKDFIIGGRGADTIEGGSRADTLCGGPGADTIYGQVGYDHLYGGRGIDRLFGGPGIDFLGGGPGADVIHGGIRNDYILGGPGNDVSYGDLGGDVFIPGPGDDQDIGGDPGSHSRQLGLFNGITEEPSPPQRLLLNIDVSTGPSTDGATTSSPASPRSTSSGRAGDVAWQRRERNPRG